MTTTATSEKSHPTQAQTLVREAAPSRAVRMQTVALIAATVGAAAVGSAVGAIWAAPPMPEPLIYGDPLLSAGPAAASCDPSPAIATAFEPALALPADEPDVAYIGVAHLIQADRLWAVIDDRPRLHWMTGDIEAHDDEGAVTLKRAIDDQLIPDGYRNLRGREVTVYDESGATCRARIGELAAVAHYLDWDGPNDSELENSWEIAGDNVVLAASLDITDGDCELPLWASNAVEEATVAELAPADGQLQRAALRAFRALPAHRKIQRAYRKETGATQKWDRSWGDSPTVTLISGARERLVVVTAMVGGCGEFDAQLSAVWRVGADDSLEQLETITEAPMGRVLAGFDRDGDGELEIIYQDDDLGHAHLERHGPRLLPGSTLSVPIYTCRC